MPLDATGGLPPVLPVRAPSGRRTIVMPWAGRNAELLARQVRCSTGSVEAIATTAGPKVLTNLRSPRGAA